MACSRCSQVEARRTQDETDLLVREAAAERRHGVLAVGHLSHDGRLLAAAGQVLVKRVLAEGLLGGDDVVAARVARGAVAREQRLAGLDVAGEGREGREERTGRERRRGDLLVGLDLWKSNFGRPTPSTRCCLRSRVSMALSFQAIHATLSP